jgi:hypothetical protein
MAQVGPREDPPMLVRFCLQENEIILLGELFLGYAKNIFSFVGFLNNFPAMAKITISSLVKKSHEKTYFHTTITYFPKTSYSNGSLCYLGTHTHISRAIMSM